MSGLLQTIRCFATGECGEPEDSVQTIETTKQLLHEVDEAVTPLRERIEADARSRPELAAALHEAEQRVLPSVGEVLARVRQPDQGGQR